LWRRVCTGLKKLVEQFCEGFLEVIGQQQTPTAICHCR
jgi:hypothetical protein